MVDGNDFSSSGANIFLLAMSPAALPRLLDFFATAADMPRNFLLAAEKSGSYCVIYPVDRMGDRLTL
ncbi:MAG: hypothetical protein K2P70_17480 [Hyphomonadaceae bacterium]|nr:hypothetical protein [Hyphomonadaceae bacterium]